MAALLRTRSGQCLLDFFFELRHFYRGIPLGRVPEILERGSHLGLQVMHPREGLPKGTAAQAKHIGCTQGVTQEVRASAQPP